MAFPSMGTISEGLRTTPIDQAFVVAATDTRLPASLPVSLPASLPAKVLNAEEVLQAKSNLTGTLKTVPLSSPPQDKDKDKEKDKDKDESRVQANQMSRRRSRKLSVDLGGNLNVMPATPAEQMRQPLIGSQRLQFTGASQQPLGKDTEPRFSSEKLKHGVVMDIVDPTEQDSDIMERMGNGVFQGSDAASRIQLVSLGASCGPKLSFKDIGRGAETLPFDWSRTKVEALLNFIGNDFAGFFDTATSYVKYNDENGREWQAYRSSIHSFWHDDPYAPAMRERYTRRIIRFQSIDARSKPVLFVRSAAATTEIPRTLELLQLLMRKFGPQAKLLLVVEFQGSAAQGPCMISGVNNLLLWSFNTAGAPAAAAPHGGIVREALDWVIGLPIKATSFPSLQAFQAIVKPNDWGFYGAGGVPAFV